jgi:hypothetical protein
MRSTGLVRHPRVASFPHACSSYCARKHQSLEDHLFRLFRASGADRHASSCSHGVHWSSPRSPVHTPSSIANPPRSPPRAFHDVPRGYEDEPTLAERPCRFEGYLLLRRVIIPDIDVSSDQHEDLVCVSIGISPEKYVRPDVRRFECVVDTNFRCFTSNSGLSCIIFHASTETWT